SLPFDKSVHHLSGLHAITCHKFCCVLSQIMFESRLAQGFRRLLHPRLQKSWLCRCYHFSCLEQRGQWLPSIHQLSCYTVVGCQQRFSFSPCLEFLAIWLF